ncbi:MAG: tetraacyldisaccharide 4'-kinase [Ignavibacteria bacterium]|nr:tetraacyldisaccharide 4'-kinase [Ignavibacteria bacterium]
MKALLPLSWLYGIVVRLRNLAFDRGLLKTTGVSVPVISVGNITAGGTGKTPLVDYIAGYFLDRSKKVAVVSRGYGRKSTGVVVVSDGSTVLVDERMGGDEPVQLARKYPRLRVVVGERRVGAVRKAIDSLNAEIIVLDDAFQHRAIRRDLDIVVVRGEPGTAWDHLLPAGLHREPPGSLGRADLVAFSRIADERQLAMARERAMTYFRGPCIGYRYTIETLALAEGAGVVLPAEAKEKTVLAFSGIGDPQSFEADLRELGLNVKDHIRFRDHHRFTRNEFQQICRRGSTLGVEMIVTTEKDMVRLSGDRAIMAMVAQGVPLFVARLSIDITHGREEFHSLLDHCLVRSHEDVAPGNN